VRTKSRETPGTNLETSEESLDVKFLARLYPLSFNSKYFD